MASSVSRKNMPLADSCSSFDGSSLTHLLTAPSPQPTLTSGVTDATGIQGTVTGVR